MTLHCKHNYIIPFISEHKVEDKAKDWEQNAHDGQNCHNRKQSSVNSLECIPWYASWGSKKSRNTEMIMYEKTNIANW